MTDKKRNALEFVALSNNRSTSRARQVGEDDDDDDDNDNDNDNDKQAQSPEDASAVVVVEMGSHWVRLGWAGEEHSLSLAESTVGRRRRVSDECDPNIYACGEWNDWGNLTDRRLHLWLKFTFPIHRGVVTDWEGLERVWVTLYYRELRSIPEEHPVVVVERPLQTKAHRERMAKTLFQHLNVPAICFVAAPLMALLAEDREEGAHEVLTGCVVDSGNSVTTITPIIAGYLVPHAVVDIPIGGHDLTLYLMELLSHSQVEFTRVFSTHLMIRQYRIGIHQRIGTEKLRRGTSPWPCNSKKLLATWPWMPLPNERDP